MRDKHWSEGVAQKAVKYSAKLSYAEATEALQELAQIEISENSVWRLTQEWGEALKQVEEKEAEHANAVLEPPIPGQAEVKSERRLGAAMDGSMIYIRGEEWKELKCGCFFEVELTPSFEPETKEVIEIGHATRTSYISHLGGPRAFWAQAMGRGETAMVACGRRHPGSGRRSGLDLEFGGRLSV